MTYIMRSPTWTLRLDPARLLGLEEGDAHLIRDVAESTESVAVAEGEPAGARKCFEAAAVLYGRAARPYWAERSTGSGRCARSPEGIRAQNAGGLDSS